jgi:two-component system, cell cycle response regulator
MGELDLDEDWRSNDETTAIINLKDLRKGIGALRGHHHLLVHIQGSELGRVRELSARAMLIGRGSDAELWLSDDGVSRKHARLIKEEDNYFLEDLGSANGTYVQGARIAGRVLLEDGNQIQMGPSAVFRYSITDDDQRSLLEQLYSTSVTDALTGARNREYLDSLLATELSYAKRHGNTVSFVIFDLDHFKNVNDSYGHPAGDSVLVKVAEAVRSQLRLEDVLCRYGGEEFGIVLRSIDLAGAHAMGERIRNVIEQLQIKHEELTLSVTTSVGCSNRMEKEDVTPQEMIALADARLYKAKHAGRNRVVSQD